MENINLFGDSLMNINLKEGIDENFFSLLNALYKPLLSKSHLKDRYKYTIFFDSIAYPVGIISINKGKNTFMQFAIIPEMRGKGIAQKALEEVIKLSGVQKVGWGCKKINYPSLKILYDFKGGLFDNVVKNKKRKSYEGYFRVGKPVSTKIYKNLEKILPDSRKLFNTWLKEYKRREKEHKELSNYLKRYANENN